MEVAEEVGRLHLPRKPPRGQLTNEKLPSHEFLGKEDDDPAGSSADNLPERFAEDTQTCSLEFNKEAPEYMTIQSDKWSSPGGLRSSICGELNGDADGGCVDGIDPTGPSERDHDAVRTSRRFYWRLKYANRDYWETRGALLSTPTFRAWLVGGRSRQEFFVNEEGVVPLLPLE